MIRFARAGAATLAFLCLTACVGVVRVYEEPGTVKRSRFERTKHAGIPFYRKVERNVQKTVYADTWWRATLTVRTRVTDRSTGSEAVTDERDDVIIRDVARGSTDQVALLNALKTEIQKNQRPTLAQANSIIDRFTHQLYNRSQLDRHRDVEIIANDVSTTWVVDDKTYYLNAPLPWFGTGSLTQKMAADGTLQEVTSTADTKIGKGLSALVPLKEYFTSRYIDASAAVETGGSDADKATLKAQGPSLLRGGSMTREALIQRSDVVKTLELEVELAGYEYTFTSGPTPSDLSGAIPFPMDESGLALLNFTRKPVGAKEEKDDEAAEQKIGINGTITLPKPAEGANVPGPAAP